MTIVHPFQDEGPHQFLFSTTLKPHVICWGFQNASERFRKNFSVHMMVPKLGILFIYTELSRSGLKVLYYLIKPHNMLQFY